MVFKVIKNESFGSFFISYENSFSSPRLKFCSMCLEGSSIGQAPKDFEMQHDRRLLEQKFIRAFIFQKRTRESIDDMHSMLNTKVPQI